MFIFIEQKKVLVVMPTRAVQTKSTIKLAAASVTVYIDKLAIHWSLYIDELTIY